VGGTLIVESSAARNDTTSVQISIIVPVYNTGPYLKRCLDSVVFNDARLFEIIIIHDGGSDNSLDVAASWIFSNDSRVSARLFDQPNAGLSAARMTGVKHAMGKYICFLDSDDIANIDVLHSAAIHAEQYDCDVVLFRSLILDDKSKKTEPFYDSWVWDHLLNKQKFRLTNLAAAPRLLRLEPNANTRIIRRDFFVDAKIEFPIGLHFEDYAPHVQQMIGARKIGLLDEIGYFYRVNRPGKITDNRDRRRFDAIKSVSKAIQLAMAAELSADAMANLALQVTRLLSWCAECVPRVHRREFCAEAVQAAQHIREEDYELAISSYANEPKERMLLDIYKRHDAAALFSLASKKFYPGSIIRAFRTLRLPSRPIK
jgi:glycosyltransferase involved in cell wall biosynthesis